MNKHLSIRINGKVQGVFFRALTKERADELDVKGFVRNEPDGSVYIEAEADERTLQQFMDWCRQGPPRARVEKMDVNEGDRKDFANFELRRD
jgi:acylphosphatase